MNAEFLKAIENISQTDLDGIELNEQVRNTVDEMENYFSNTEFEFERTGSNYHSLKKGFNATDLLLELYICFNNVKNLRHSEPVSAQSEPPRRGL